MKALACAASQFADEHRFITASEDGTAKVWDAQTGQPLPGPLQSKGSRVMSAQFSPDGKRILTVSSGVNVQVWDAESGQQLSEPLLPIDGVYSAQFSPDGKRVLTAGVHSAQIWDIAPSATKPPDWLPQLAEAISGKYLNDQGFLKPTTLDRGDVLNQLRQRLNQEPDDAGWVHWGRWFLADPAERTISPFSKIMARTDHTLSSQLNNVALSSSNAVQETASSPSSVSPVSATTSATNWVRLVSTTPASPATLKGWQSLAVHLQYSVGNETNLTIYVSPKCTQMEGVPARRDIEDQILPNGEALASFGCSGVDVCELDVAVYGGATGKLLVQEHFPVDFHWEKAPPEPKKEMVILNPSVSNSVSIVSITPASPAMLHLNERMTLKLQYSCKTRAVEFWVRPSNKGSNGGFFTNGSQDFAPIAGRGETDYCQFGSRYQADADAVEVIMVDPETKMLCRNLLISGASVKG